MKKTRTVFLLLLLWAAPAAVRAQFNYETNAGTITIAAYTGAGGAVIIPTNIAGLPVTSIGDFAFIDTGVTSVPIPPGVTSIGMDAFDACASLATVAIPGSVTNLGEEAF